MASSTAAPAPCLNLGPVERIPLGEGRVLVVAGIAVAVFRARSGALFATEPSCPHQGGPLADGLLGGSVVVCPLHGYRFDLATGRPLGHSCRPLRTYVVEASAAGDLLLWPAAGPAPG
jgi:nitrite reductase (NADH) small subunit